MIRSTPRIDIKKIPDIPGLYIYEEIISSQAEDELVNYFDSILWNNDLKRRTQQYGYSYNYKNKRSVYLPNSPIEGPLKDLNSYITEYFKLNMDRIIVNEYTKYQGISPHVDSPIFGPVILGLVLLHGSNFIMTNSSTGQTITLWIPPRSIYIMTGESRYDWKHSIPSNVDMIGSDGEIVKRGSNYRRISVTFRSGL